MSAEITRLREQLEYSEPGWRCDTWRRVGETGNALLVTRNTRADGFRWSIQLRDGGGVLCSGYASSAGRAQSKAEEADRSMPPEAIAEMKAETIAELKKQIARLEGRP